MFVCLSHPSVAAAVLCPPVRPVRPVVRSDVVVLCPSSLPSVVVVFYPSVPPVARLVGVVICPFPVVVLCSSVQSRCPFKN